jgi:hypothetical protein
VPDVEELSRVIVLAWDAAQRLMEACPDGQHRDLCRFVEEFLVHALEPPRRQ